MDLKKDTQNVVFLKNTSNKAHQGCNEILKKIIITLSVEF